MCLTTTNIQGEVSDKPIKCYKIYERLADGVLTSYFVRMIYKIKKGDTVVAEDTERIEDVLKGYQLHNGFIHAMREKPLLLTCLVGMYGKASKLHMLMLQLLDGGNREVLEPKIDRRLNEILDIVSSIVLCEMEIPAGEKYWLGEDGDICAKKMILGEEFKVKKSELIMWIYTAFDFNCCVYRKEEVLEECLRWSEKYKKKGE